MFKEKYKPLIKMSKYISFYKKEFIISIIYGIFNSVFALLTVLTGAYIASAALFKMSTGKILYLFIPLIIFIIGKGLFAFLEMSFGFIRCNRKNKKPFIWFDCQNGTAIHRQKKKRKYYLCVCRRCWSHWSFLCSYRRLLHNCICLHCSLSCCIKFSFI